MTVTSPASGFRARLHRLARGAAVFVTAAALLMVGGVSAATAATEEPEVAEETTELFVSAGLRGVVPIGAPVAATVTLRNSADEELSPARVALEVNRTALTDAESLTAWLSEGSFEGGFTSLLSTETLPVPAASEMTTNVSITPEQLGALPAGVYPLRALLTGATTSDQQHDQDAATVLVVTDAAAPQVGVLVPITATPASGALLAADELTELTGPEGALSAQLDAVAGTLAILAVDPAIPAAIRSLGVSAPQTAIDWLERLEALPNDRFLLQFGDADATTQAHAGEPALLEPLGLSAVLDEANFLAVAPTIAPEPTPTPAVAEEPQIPTPDDLTAVERAAEGFLWPRADTTVDDLTLFDQFLQAPTTTILPTSSASGAAGASATAGGHSLLLYDAAASAAFSEAAGEPDDLRRDALLTGASAQLFFASAHAPDAPLLVGLDRDETRTAAALRAAIDTASRAPVDLDVLTAAPAASVSLTAEPDESRAPALRTLLEEERQLSSFATILDEPQLLLSPERTRILRVIAVGVPTEQFSSEFADHRRATERTLNAVGVQRPSNIQLFAANAELPVWVRNELPWAVNLNLSADPSDPRLDVQEVTPLVAQPQSNTRVKVPVSARVGSGQLDVELSLTSPIGVSIGSPEVARVAVRAEWENIGLIIFGGLAGLLILFGVVRTVRRKRREHAEADAAKDADAEGSVSSENPEGTHE